MKRNSIYNRMKLSAAPVCIVLGTLAALVHSGVQEVSHRRLETMRDSLDYTTISLEPVANRNFRDDTAGDGKGGWSDQGENSIYGMPTGVQTFMGIPFDISSTAGKQCLVMRGQNDSTLPTTATLPVGASGTAVYFLHAAAWPSPVIGSYTVTYSGRKSETITIRNKIEVFDFWSPGASAVARQFWSGENPKKKGIGLTGFVWKNPHPKKKIESITVQTPGDGAYLMLCGVTLSDGPSYLPKEPVVEFVGKDWFAWKGIDIEQRRGTALDMSRFLSAPAGTHGWLGKAGEDFRFEDGTTMRFWGMSVSDQANFPSRRQAEFMAEYIA